MSAGEGVAARHSSETAEHYTPRYIVESARFTLETIDFDPFSCAEANETVKATRIISLPDDGFAEHWTGRTFVNPPGGRGPNNESNQKRAWIKLAANHAVGRVRAAIFVCFSVELLQTTQVKAQGRIPLDFPICYPSKRIAYVKPGGTVGGSPPHSSCIIYLPPPSGEPMWARDGVNRFRQAFASIGRVVVPTS